jgi:hypothetical protein
MSGTNLCKNFITERRKNIVNYLNEYLPKDISKMISFYKVLQ